MMGVDGTMDNEMGKEGMKLKTEYLELRDVRIAYCQHGSGPVLILLHGNSTSKETFTTYCLEHFTDFSTIALDSRGHGETSSADVEFCLETLSEDVIAFCRSKNISHAYVVGYSDGGNIALHLAKKAPYIFTKIAAVSPNYLAEGLKDVILRSVKGIIAFLSLLDRLGLDTARSISKFSLITNDIGLTEDDLRSIITNVKIIYAQNDVVKETHIEQMAALIPGAGKRMVKRSNHFNILHKQETIETIRQYLLEK
jgi:pimeloyl-ACP methyl ester carboxylesterase